MHQMTAKEKFLFIFLQIITLGLIWIYWNRQKQQFSQANQLTYATKTNFDTQTLINLVGSITNIINVTHTHTKIKIEFENRDLIDATAIKNLKGVSGIFINDQFLTVILGNEAKLVCEAILAQMESPKLLDEQNLNLGIEQTTSDQDQE